MRCAIKRPDPGMTPVGRPLQSARRGTMTVTEGPSSRRGRRKTPLRADHPPEGRAMSRNGNPAAIRHGMFIMPFHDPAKPAARCYDEDLELIVRAEGLGFTEFWIGEHHTMKYENIVMPEIFIARALGE